jgi:hypothetical protein
MMGFKVSELVADLAGQRAHEDLRKVKGAIVPRGTYGGDNDKRRAKKKN